MAKTKSRRINDEIQGFFRWKNISIAWRKDDEDIWDRNLDWLKTRYFTPDELLQGDKVCINLVHPHVRVVVPAVYSKNPDVTIEPGRKDSTLEVLMRARANTIHKITKYYIDKCDIKTEIKLCLLDMVITGHAWAKNGYETAFAKQDEDDDEQRVNLIDKLIATVFSDKEEEEESSASFINWKITKESPWVLRTSYKDILVPALSRRFEEVGQIAERFIIPWSEAQENPDWNLKGVSPTANANTLLASLRKSGFDPKSLPDGEEQEYLVGWEVWKEDGKRKCIIAEDFYDHYLQEDDSPFTYTESGYHPYTMLRSSNEVSDQFYPESDLNPAQPQFDELNDLRSAQISHIKRISKRRYLTKAGMLDQTQKAALINGPDGTVAETTELAGDEPLGNVFMPIQDAQMDPEIFTVESRIKDDAINILGTTDFATASSGGANSATEAQIIAAQSRFRVDERVDIINTFAEKVIVMMLQMLLKNMSKEKAMEILGEEGMYWRRYNNDDDIRGEFICKAIYGSTTPIAKETKLIQFERFYAQTVQDPMYDGIKIRLEYLEKWRDFLNDNPESYLNPQVAAAIQQAMLKAAAQGDLQALYGASGSPNEAGRVPDPSKRGPRNLRAAQANGGMTKGPRIPGGKGGTQGSKEPLESGYS